MSIIRKMNRARARKAGALPLKDRRHTVVAFRTMNIGSLYQRASGGFEDVLVTERHYLHATKGWKTDRYTRKTDRKLVIGTPKAYAQITAFFYQRTTNPNSSHAAAEKVRAARLKAAMQQGRAA